MIALHPGDIVEANGDSKHWPRYPIRIEGPNPAARPNAPEQCPYLGTSPDFTGHVRTNFGVAEYDRLVACGAHEDCRDHLDMAMACAAVRLASEGRDG